MFGDLEIKLMSMTLPTKLDGGFFGAELALITVKSDSSSTTTSTSTNN